MLKKVLTWLAVAFVVFYVIQRPDDAAGIDTGQSRVPAAQTGVRLLGDEHELGGAAQRRRSGAGLDDRAGVGLTVPG